MSTFTGIVTALSSLQAQMQAMNTAGHNIANVNTPGFRRQEAILGSRLPLPPPGSGEASTQIPVGTGVAVQTIRRAQDGYLGLHLRATASECGQWSTTYTALREIEAIVAPAPGEGLGTLLDRFWDAWQTLSTRPDDLASRMQVRDQGEALAEGFKDLSGRLSLQAENLNVAIADTVEEINRIATEAAELNRKIAFSVAEGKPSNDLMDQRDALIMRLCELTGATLYSAENAPPVLNLNGRSLVQGESAFELKAEIGVSGNMEVFWAQDGTKITFDGGVLAAQSQMLEVAIPGYLNTLDDIASTLAAEVNARHQAGFGLDNSTGVDFFTAGSTAANISVDAAILADVRAIATAAGVDSPGDGSVAIAIAGLRNEAVMPGGESIAGAWRSFVGGIGGDVQEAEYNDRGAQLLSEQLYIQQQSLAGVSLDEEMAQMIQFQHAYDAAARVMSAVDEMIASLIERMR